jgi:hypothetical protein
MEVWAKTEAAEAENPSVERVCWFVAADGSGGVAVTKVADADAVASLSLEVSLALGEFIELDSKVVLDMETAMPAIVAAMAY